MFHATTVLAVRHRDQAVMAGDGQVTFGQTVVKQSARKIRRLYNDRILAGFAGSAADSFALFSRFEAKLEQYRGNLERSAVELAKDWRTDRILRRLEAMLIVARQDVDVPAVRQRRSDRARRWHRGDRIGRAVRAGGGQGAGAQHRARRARDRREGDGDRRRDLHLHQRQHRRSKSCRAVPIYLPETTQTSTDIADAAADRRRARQVRRSARRRPSAPSRSRCATACGARSCRRSSPRRSRRRTS